MIAVRQCLPDNLPHAWPVVEPWLRRAAERYTPRRRLEDDLADLKNGSQQLFVVLDDGEIIAGITTLIHDQPLMRVCTMRLVGGDRLDEWRADAIAEIARFARENGCRELEQMGPKGWRRLNAEFEHRGEWLVMEL